MANLVSASLGKVLVSVQDRCTVCTKSTIGLFSKKSTIGLEIILDEVDGTPR
jgi:hypothetical protein